VNVAVLSPEHFDKWDSFRNLLLVKTVPMVQMLPRKERQKILQNLQIRDFKDGDYIIRQGEQGEQVARCSLIARNSRSIAATTQVRISSSSKKVR
jgi:CRP-like cAMP-binding protein